MTGSSCPEYPDGSLAVMDGYYGKIYFYDGPVTASSSAAATITLPNTDYDVSGGMTFDASGDLWVAYSDGYSGYKAVLEYAAPLTTGESPSITITGSSTGFNSPVGISFNASTSNIYVADLNGNKIDVFGDTANGNVAPSATISGSSTGLSQPNNIKTDASYIYVASEGGAGIERFNLTDSGNVYPGEALFSSVQIDNFAFDTAKDIYYPHGSAVYAYTPIGGYAYAHEFTGSLSLYPIAIDDSGFVYGTTNGADVYIYNPTNYASSLTLGTTLSVGYNDVALAVFSPGNFTGTEPQ